MCQHGDGADSGLLFSRSGEQSATVGGMAPRAVVWAFVVWLLVVALGMIAVALSFSSGRSVLAGNGPQGPGSLFSPRGLVVVSVPVLWWVFEIVAAFALRRGRRWARVLLTVMGAISLALDLVGFAGALPAAVQGTAVGASEPVFDLILSAAQASAIVAALVLSYRPASNRYLSRARR